MDRPETFNFDLSGTFRLFVNETLLIITICGMINDIQLSCTGSNRYFVGFSGLHYFFFAHPKGNFFHFQNFQLLARFFDLLQLQSVLRGFIVKLMAFLGFCTAV